MDELALFAGAGGGILGGTLLGWRTVCAVEIEPYPASVLCSRQNDGVLPTFPIWDDIRTFDGRPWRGIVDVISGGFPCQDISSTGKGIGITGEKSGLWVEMARIIGEVRPRYVLVENSPMLTARGLGVVLGDLAALGYDARWGVLGAADVGAPHLRKRIWIVADSSSGRFGSESERKNKQQRRDETVSSGEAMVNANGYDGSADGGESNTRPDRRDKLVGRGEDVRYANSQGLEIREGEPGDNGAELQAAIGADWWAFEPDVGRVANGVADRVDRIKALGNGQVPQCMAEAWRVLS